MSVARGVISWLATQRGFTRAVGGTGMRLGFARRFIAGETLDDALAAAARLNAAGLSVILNQLGEHVKNAEEARASYHSYLEILQSLSHRKIDGMITVKPTQIALELDFDLCRELTLELVRRAEAIGNFVEIDMEHSGTTEATVSLFEHVRRQHENVGLAVQSYLRRTRADLERLRPLHPKIRLVKGAYQEPADVAFPDKGDVDQSYRELMGILFADGFVPAIATHDEALLAEAKSLAKRHHRSPREWEVQMLLGVRRDLQDSLAREGYQMRVYVTYGTEWVPYFMRRLAERPANVAFVLRSLMKKGS
ncbi:MAG TPA: proline dehydrogenase family protein [Candidatus Eisenbacteria bacterium]|jgi:proline dehydrogenase|nr:proline dehydrogenase family protein [Candidatus Eisenbacteria bacterium]